MSIEQTSQQDNLKPLSEWIQIYGSKMFEDGGEYYLAVDGDSADRRIVAVIDSIINPVKGIPPNEESLIKLKDRFIEWLNSSDISLDNFKKHPNFKILQGLLTYLGESFKTEVRDLVGKKDNLISWVEEIVEPDTTNVSISRNRN